MITIDDKSFRASAKRLRDTISNLRPVYRRTAAHMRDYVRQTITSQGRSKPYQPLAPTTVLKTGRRKALLELRPRIKSSYSSQNAIVFFEKMSPHWDDLSHHFGFRSKAVVNKRMILPNRKGKTIHFTSRKESVIPAREIWPNDREIKSEIVPLFNKFIKEAIRKNWR